MSKIVLSKLYRTELIIMTLNELPIGETAIVTDVTLKGAIRRRLYDLGLINGTMVESVLKSSRGNPIAYNIRGALIALRNSDTKKIIISHKG